MENEWAYIHAFRKLVADEKAAPLRCPEDNFILASRLKGDDDKVWLWCANCDSWSRPGAHVFNQIRSIVHEHYV